MRITLKELKEITDERHQKEVYQDILESCSAGIPFVEFVTVSESLKAMLLEDGYSIKEFSDNRVRIYGW